MEHSKITLGSPQPVTPSKRRSQTASELLAAFAASQTHSSVSQLRKSPSVLVYDPLTTPQRAEYIPMSQSPELRRSDGVSRPHNLRLKQISSYAMFDGSDSSVSPSTSSSFSSPEQSPGIDMLGDDTEDELQRLTRPERMSASGRTLRPRSVLTPTASALGHVTRSSQRQQTKGSRSSKTILLSDTLQAPKAKSARLQIRSDIASITKKKQDNFLLANKDYFLPLLPTNNYIQKLEHSLGSSRSQRAVVPYRALEQPKGIKAMMKPYQLTGLSFLVNLYENGMSGMLGDEMGLGKTLQTLSLFQHLKENVPVSSNEIRPFLVICPLSVLNSWVVETRKWTPGLRTLRFHGGMAERKLLKEVALGRKDRYGNDTARVRKRKRDQRHKSGKPLIDLDSDTDNEDDSTFDLVITTYETFTAEASWFKSAFVWRYVVLDEGHKIKNNLSNISRALQGLKAEYRLILTGTPLQNNLHEMWALLHWLYPNVFGDRTAELFTESFNLTRGKVDTSVMDSARRLLELIMIRRMKDSPEVNLGLPPKEEILLYVPLSPMQRFWYTRLLTQASDGLLEDLFRNVKDKEKEALRKEAAEDETWAQLESMERKASTTEQPDEWSETKEIMRKALEQEENDTSGGGAWRRLMNLVMQLRKCCSHPYLLPNAAPDPYLLGEHVIRASGKFIVLEKLLRDLIVQKRKKVLIFSGFTKMLSCTEDLLHLIGGDGSNFQYLRLDGSTSRARRNLNIRLFNDNASDYKAMLISTRAGGLGINLASASDVIFLDEDWNPQITLQAEARAHRIGQTQPVTVYKLCTQGTVEEQMMGRIRKKLYLSAKITESMRNIHGKPTKSSSKRGPQTTTEDMPQLDTSQLMSLVRRGAQTLSHPEIDVTEMLSWDLDTILEKCKDRPSDPHVAEQAAQTSTANEEKWLSVMERVECAVFDGKRYQKSLTDNTSVLPDDIAREDRRKGKNTTVMIDGFAINKESLLCGDWEAVPTLAGKDPRLASPKREKKPDVPNQSHCQVCWDGGELICCHGCPRSYHYACLPNEAKARTHGFGNFHCPQHECADCEKKTTDAGGLIYRCRWCPKGYCEDCLDWDQAQLIGENLVEYETLGFGPIEQAFYVVCHDCREYHAEDEEARRFVEEQAELFEVEYESWREGGGVLGEEDSSRAPSLTESDTLASTSGVSTPKTPVKLTLKTKKRKSEAVEEGKVVLSLKMRKLEV